jgi:predicted Zn-dependent protease
MHILKHLPAFWRLGLLFITIAGGTGCAGLMMTPDQEIQFGDQVARKIADDNKLVSDPVIVNYIRHVGQRVWENSPPSPIQAHFFVIQDDNINAFAIPGGNIYINTGLINAADDEAELAFVMAHEAGHVICRHCARHLSEKHLHKIQRMLTVNLTFSREDENQADEIAVNTLYRAGYDPMALRRFFAKLSEKSTERNLVAKLFASHPPTQERIAHVESMARALPPRRYERPITGLRRAQYRLKKSAVQGIEK